MKNKKTSILETEECKLAHVDYETKRCQSMQEHAGNVARFAKDACELPELRSIVELAGILHDAGKLGTANQDDFKNILELGDKVYKHGLDHSTAGGRIALELMKEEPVSEFISTLIYFHHGMEDCINLENGQNLQERWLKKEIEYRHIKEGFFQIYDRTMLEKAGEKAVQSYQEILKKINGFVKKYDSSGKKYGSRYFYLGMYLRTALSLLIDGDWTDTACFFQDIPLSKIRDAQAALQKILDDFKYDNKKFNYSLDSEIAIKFYYSVYRSQLRKLETKFPVEVCGVTVTLTDLLGKNQIGQNQYCRKHKEKGRTKLPQAFQTAGSEFEVISDTYKLSVVVPYGIEPKLLLKELSQVRTETEKKKILRKLQRYTVGISESRRNKLGNTVYENSEGILVLCDGHYDKKVGVVDEPKMDFCNI